MAGVKRLLIHFRSVAVRSHGLKLWLLNLLYERKNVSMTGVAVRSHGLKLWSLNLLYERKNVSMTGSEIVSLPVYVRQRMWTKLLVKLLWKSY